MLSNIINELKTHSSTNQKLEILKSHQDSDLVKTAFKYCLDPHNNYWIKSPSTFTSGIEQLTAYFIRETFDTLKGRVVTGNAARDYFEAQLGKLLPSEGDILCRILDHDMDCKVSDGLVNRVWKGLVPKFPVMLSEKYEDYHHVIPEGEIIVQKKEDGGRVEIAVDSVGNVTTYSRSGNILLTHGVFDNVFGQFRNMVFDGELLVLSDTGVADRKTGNGFFNKAVRQTIKPEEAVKFHVVVWDVIDRDDWVKGYSAKTTKQRLAELVKHMEKITHRASLVPTKIVKTHKEVEAYYLEMIDHGFEGAMVKDPNAPWEDDRVRTCLKMKEVNDATLKCVAVKPHSKNKALIGSLECVTSCGKLEVSIGSGLTDKDRMQPPEYFLGKMIDMCYNMLITDKNSDKHSMFLPRFRDIRVDVKEADSLEKLQ